MLEVLDFVELLDELELVFDVLLRYLLVLVVAASLFEVYVERVFLLTK